MEIRSVRELMATEAEFIVDYFYSGDSDFLWNMGVDPGKLRPKKEWASLIAADFEQPISKREFYYLLWLVADQPVGHSNLNHITFGNEANMHLHMWFSDRRQKGDGIHFIRLCLANYFEKFELKKIICEPNAKNPAPNRLLEKLGFTFIKNHRKNPGFINYYQTLSRWEMTRDFYHQNF